MVYLHAMKRERKSHNQILKEAHKIIAIFV